MRRPVEQREGMIVRTMIASNKTAALSWPTLLWLVWLLVPSQASAQPSGPPFPSDGAKLVNENDLVVVWDVTRALGANAPMHELTVDQVSVTLTPGTVKITRLDGSWTIEYEPLGFVRFEPRGATRSIAVAGDGSSRVVVFQLKVAPDLAWSMTDGIPGQFPRVGAEMLFETGGFRVWDQTWSAGVRIANHFHYVPTAAVFLDGGALRTLDENGPNPPFSRSLGDVIASTSPMVIPHSEEHVAGRPRAIWIEFKPVQP